MHPTIEEQLSGARRLLGVLDSTSELSAEARELLANIGRLVHQAQVASVSAMAFYRQDNLGLLELLARLDPSPGDAARTPWAVEGETVSDASRNTELRAELCRVIERLQPDAPERDEVGRYLLRRVEQNPT